QASSGVGTPARYAHARGTVRWMLRLTEGPVHGGHDGLDAVVCPSCRGRPIGASTSEDAADAGDESSDAKRRRLRIECEDSEEDGAEDRGARERRDQSERAPSIERHGHCGFVPLGPRRHAEYLGVAAVVPRHSRGSRVTSIGVAGHAAADAYRREQLRGAALVELHRKVDLVSVSHRPADQSSEGGEGRARGQPQGRALHERRIETHLCRDGLHLGEGHTVRRGTGRVSAALELCDLAEDQREFLVGVGATIVSGHGRNRRESWGEGRATEGVTQSASNFNVTRTVSPWLLVPRTRLGTASSVRLVLVARQTLVCHVCPSTVAMT